MPLIRTPAWVLRHYDFGETSRVMVFFTATTGKLRGVMKGARTLKSRFAGTLDPFTLVDLTCYRKAGRELDLIRFCDPIPGQPRMPADLAALAARSYFAELVDHFFQEGDPNPAGFRLLDQTMRALAAGIRPGPLARYVEYWLLRLQGVYPDHRTCPACGIAPERLRFVRRASQFLCPTCGGREAVRLPAATGAFLTFCAGRPPGALADRDWPVGMVSRLGQVHRMLVEGFLGKGLNSYRVLAQLEGSPPWSSKRSS